MDWMVAVIFLGVYAGMIAGGVRGLALDRTGIVLLGAIAMIATGSVSLNQAWAAVDVPTMALLFGLMVVSAQFRLGGFYTLTARRLGASLLPAPRFLLVLILVAGGLSALLANDIICLAMTPVLLEICTRRRLHPLPFLVGLACAANIGSAATLIGNPQNMLIGQVLHLSFVRYLVLAAIPSAAGLLLCWGIIAWMFRGKWEHSFEAGTAESPAYDRWQTAKGMVVLAALVVLFVGNWMPREHAALAAAGLLLLSRRMASSRFLALIDWNLLLLFLGLFVVNHALAESGLLAAAIGQLAQVGMDLNNGAILFGSTAVLSNLVSNVPATMLLLPATQHPLAGPILALSSTLAGNLILVGSIANLIVVEQAQRLGVRITWAEHARIGVPVTLATLGVAGAWLALLA